jgi:hypothetical protein
MYPIKYKARNIISKYKQEIIKTFLLVEKKCLDVISPNVALSMPVYNILIKFYSSSHIMDVQRTNVETTYYTVTDS